MKRLRGEAHSPCHCCALQTPDSAMRLWRQRTLCRQLVVPAQRAALPAPTADEWVSGLYRYYYVTHEHRVCEACHAHLSEGGKLHGGLRNRAKMAFVVMVVILAILIVSLPVLLPHLRSALWLN